MTVRILIGDVREQLILDFSDGKFRVLSTKPIIAGSGCNLQRHCHREIFAGIGFKFNDFIQSLHRVQRFGQEHPVRIDIVDRLIERYSNKGERVYDPFCGLGTVPYRAILKGRTGGGSELSAAYFMDQVHYLKAAERQVSMPDLFASLEVAA
jgi:hypothetical protein